MICWFVFVCATVRYEETNTLCVSLSCRERAKAGDLMLEPHAELHFTTSGPGADFLKAFSLSQSTWADQPLSIDTYTVRQTTVADCVIEEFMLVGNYLAARKLSSAWLKAREASAGTSTPAAVPPAPTAPAGVGEASAVEAPSSDPSPSMAVSDSVTTASVGGDAPPGGPPRVRTVALAPSTVLLQEPVMSDIPPAAREFVFRRHPPPRAEQLRTVQSFCDKRGVSFDASDGKRMQWSFNHLQATGVSDATITALQRQIIHCLPRAGAGCLSACACVIECCCPAALNVCVAVCACVCVCPGSFHAPASQTRTPEFFVTDQCPPSQWSYFDFGVPCYANFTSPIRRFADVLTHRALALVLEAESRSEAAVASNRARALELGVALPTPSHNAYFYGSTEVSLQPADVRMLGLE